MRNDASRIFIYLFRRHDTKLLYLKCRSFVLSVFLTVKMQKTADAFLVHRLCFLAFIFLKQTSELFDDTF